MRLANTKHGRLQARVQTCPPTCCLESLPEFAAPGLLPDGEGGIMPPTRQGLGLHGTLGLGALFPPGWEVRDSTAASDGRRRLLGRA